MGKQVSARIKNKIKKLFARSINQMEKSVARERSSSRFFPKKK